MSANGVGEDCGPDIPGPAESFQPDEPLRGDAQFEFGIDCHVCLN
jgi:hypothetical protein